MKISRAGRGPRGSSSGPARRPPSRTSSSAAAWRSDRLGRECPGRGRDPAPPRRWNPRSTAAGTERRGPRARRRDTSRSDEGRRAPRPAASLGGLRHVRRDEVHPGLSSRSSLGGHPSRSTSCCPRTSRSSRSAAARRRWRLSSGSGRPVASGTRSSRCSVAVRASGSSRRVGCGPGRGRATASGGTPTSGAVGGSVGAVTGGASSSARGPRGAGRSRARAGDPRRLGRLGPRIGDELPVGQRWRVGGVPQQAVEQRAREWRRLRRKQSSSRWDRVCSASTRPWWVPSSHRLHSAATRCTAGSSSLACLPEPAAAPGPVGRARTARRIRWVFAGRRPQGGFR